jgi:hypothetical protein
MTRTLEGDICALGLVTLYFGYAEAEIDELLETLSLVEAFDDVKRQWPVGRRLAHAKSLISSLSSNDLAELNQRLDEAAVLFDRRNALVHSAIYAKTKVVSLRTSGLEQPVSPDGLAELARKIFDCREHINAKRQRVLEPLLGRLGPIRAHALG